MPIYTSEVKKNKLESNGLVGSNINAADFTKLVGGTTSTWFEVKTKNSNITVDGVTVNPFYSIKMLVHSHRSGGFFYTGLLIDRALQPGEEVKISGYFFKGGDPTFNGSSTPLAPWAILYETDSSNFTDFKTKPNTSTNPSFAAGEQTVADVVGQGVVPAADGTNVGALNNGWKYNTTGRSAAASTQARNIDNSGDQTDATLHQFNLNDEGAFGSRFYTITIRNDTTSEAYLKLGLWDVSNTLADSSNFGSVHDLRAEFDTEVKSPVIETKGISGITDSPLTIRADKNINFKVDQDADESGKFSFVNGSNSEVASIDEIGNMQLDGQLLINGQYLKFESASNLQILDIKNTHNSTAPINAFITKNKNGGVGHSNDVIADFSFVSDDDQGDPFTFCGIKAEPLSVGDNAASGALEFNVLTASGGGQGNSTGLKIKGSSSTLNRVDLDIGNGATSLVTVAGNLQVTTDIVLGTTSLSGYFVPAYIHRKMGGSTTALAAEFNPWDTDNSTSNSYIGIPGAGVTYDSATGRFTVAAAGKYEIISVNYILSNSGTAVGHTLKIKKNGSDVLHTSEFMAHNAVDPVERTLMTMDALAANDYIEILADSDSTATLTFTPGTSISIKKIAS